METDKNKLQLLSLKSIIVKATLKLALQTDHVAHTIQLTEGNKQQVI